MNWFLVIAVSICAALLLFLGYRITGIGTYSWLLASLIVGTVLLYPLVWYGVLPEKPDLILRALVHFDIGLLGLLLTFLILRDILFLPLVYLKVEWVSIVFSKSATSFLFSFSFLLLAVGFWKAKLGPELVSVEIPINNLPSSLENYKIVQISDLHTGPGIDATYVNNAVEMALNQKADLVVLTGDIADGSFERYQSYLASLSKLTVQSQVLYVVGNHEYLKDSDKWLAYFKSLGIQVLMNEHLVVPEKERSILFAGVIDPEVKEVDPGSGPDLQKALLGSPETDLKILLAHQPNIAEEAAPYFDLQLSGHTHAGQFFPWNILIKLFQPYTKGLNKCENMWVYTNSGTGYWGPPFRLGTTSEITVLKLTKQ
ncbi:MULTISPECIES: metallophosphoesterase [Leeuwenhoekiella]|nr:MULTISPECIES: metallophosphoesterase [Leeuwenhoekiella]MEC7783095.1 metallophosphoesterase [Bacteroidota bacterium]UBZ10897.1 metallophosphoesterase [Leeuwenhoekiella palythoae]HBO29463.1 metallophosphoesterase [Leeuwenhoekiella sp.]HCQ78320.1 metallophosphoesterase [Leeuwenhoekiella sp.]|tara:strand:+ start:1915 stop:3027 length:1113 start_codon:yes stop_codon:yes gene_type:complete